MGRNEDEMGEDADMATVMNKYVLDQNCLQINPVVIDVQNDRFIALNEQSQEFVASKNIVEILSKSEYHTEKANFDLETLILANVSANGELTSPDKAQKLFVTKEEYDALIKQYPNVNFEKKEIIFPDNVDYITGILMQDGPGLEIPKSKDNVSKSLDDIIEETTKKENNEEKSHRKHHKKEEDIER